MKPNIKKLWVRALRSGEYEQGRRKLHKDGKFCCLGVLCDLHAKKHGKEWEKTLDDTLIYLGAAGSLPDQVFRWSGIYVDSVVIDEELLSLAEHNDNGRTFAEIADAIEEQL